MSGFYMSDLQLDDFDFGFTTTSEAQIIGENGTAEEMYKLILPLLNNLMKDAETNDYIHWPNRKEKIEAFKAKLEALIK